MLPKPLPNGNLEIYKRVKTYEMRTQDIYRFGSPMCAALLAGCSWLAPGLNVEGTLSSDPNAPSGAPVQIQTITAEMIKKQADAALAAKGPAEQALPDIASLTADLSTGQYRVGPGDVLSFVLWDRPDLGTPQNASAGAGGIAAGGVAGGVSGTTSTSPLNAGAPQGQQVSGEGLIFFPYVGEIKVAGLTLREVRSLITSALSKYIRNPQLDVQIVGFRSQRVQVTGLGVVQPGMVAVTDQPITVVSAVASAGGLKPEADPSSITLIRQGKVIPVDLTALYQGRNLDRNWVLHSGDVLSVPDTRERRVFVMGEVLQQKVIPMSTARLSLADALGQAAGTNQLGSDPSRIYVIRGAAQSPTPEVFHLNANRADGLLLATRFELQPLDVVYVSTADATKFARIVSEILPSLSAITSAAALDRLIRP